MRESRAVTVGYTSGSRARALRRAISPSEIAKPSTASASRRWAVEVEWMQKPTPCCTSQRSATCYGEDEGEGEGEGK